MSPNREPDQQVTKESTTNAHRPLLLLGLGAAAGLVLAATGLLRSGTALPGTLDAGVAATVNGAVIRSDDYERLVSGFERDTRAEADAATRKRLLDRMIDEELLVQRALELGLANSDRKIRGELTAAVIRAVVVEAEERQPTQSELERFFDDERAFFTQPGRLRVQEIFFRIRNPDEEATAASRAAAARDRLLAGEPFEEVRGAGDAAISQVPDVLLPATKLREYLGPTALAAAQSLEPGAPSEPVRSGTGYHVLRVVEREPARTPELSAIEPQVRAEWRRRAGDEALRDYLDELRERADVSVDSAP